MFAKIYHQIFDSSIAEDHQVRHCFMDLLVLADRDGVVDMTLEAISRRTNVPIEQIARCIAELSQTDTRSRSTEESGVRIKLIDSHRDWGWQIVNYAHYRELRDDEGRRSYFRDYKRKQRAKTKPSPRLSTDVHTCPAPLTQAEAEAEAEGSTNKGTAPIYRKFKVPTIEEVKLLMAKVALPESEAEKFWNFYESKGWMVGKTKMRQVGNAVANWATRYREWHPTAPAAEQPKPTGSERMVHLEEFKRVEAKMKSIKDSYAEHQAWSEPDRELFTKLRARKLELKKLLGMQV